MPYFTVSARELRLGKGFDIIDIDHDGVTNLGDWEEFASYMCAQFRTPFESPIGTQVRNAVLSWWHGVPGPQDAIDGEMHKSQFTAHYGGTAEAEVAALIRRWVDAVFALCDGDADGWLSLREIAGVLRVHGVPEQVLTRTIQHFTVHDDGISKDECAALMLDYYLGTDARPPGSALFGEP
ncbi:MAG TPA: hypothetical protein VGZ32_08310 [Actinocrinis sp.]|jgi:hypothetical protein|uniref:EF-hand domain-containing protein n=1 Tax=Actinocrinis sp. TaxID=1920516 RepID=UPI002DDD6CF6|nr:hypothetical protein [Actinocrinis sp.]HEV3170326.1 hypothetical protein [Actinocrinis sp.]